jgi:tRNA G10  N-methylase Trm11
MHTYAATYITGWEEIVETALRHDIPDFELLFSEDGLIVFQTEQSYEQLQMISYLNNIFFVYHFDNASGQNKSVHAVVKSLAQKGSFKPLQGKTYRLMVMHGSKLEHVTREISNMLKSKITNQTGLEFSPLKADIEFWVLIRNSGAVVFGYKTENESQKIPVQQGELRPKIAELLVMASKPMPEDTFLDPFAGYGSIPAARIRLEPYSKLICVEQKGKLVEELKRRFRTEQNVEVRQGDALHMTFIQNASVDVIVSDPPWGMYEEVQ